MSTRNEATASTPDGPQGAAAGWRRGLAAASCLAALCLLAACERTQTDQRGFRGTGLIQVKSPQAVLAAAQINRIPEPEPRDPPDPDAPATKDVFKNVRVLNDLSVLDFSRLMQALSTWVAPEQGCEFCHNPEKLDSDEKYTKVVARRMLQMTRKINTEWKAHVAGTGVTCWTCHRGQAVPSGDWFTNPGPDPALHLMGHRDQQNQPGIAATGNSSLPNDALSAFLDHANEIRVQGVTALAGPRHDSVKQAEWTYSLMVYMANSLGVNCDYCHNTRAFGRWEESAPQRVTAWHGIRMVRDLNNGFLDPLRGTFPAYRLSAAGDGPKVGCATCHKGSFKPLAGVSMLPDYPELAGVMVYPPADAASAAQAAVMAPAPHPSADHAPSGTRAKS
jgi:photosynthetic reaction center cytochrome c subunit